MEPFPDSSLYTSMLLFIGSTALCALFAFLETSIAAIRLFRLKELAEHLPRYRRVLSSLEQNPTRLLNTIIIANNFANTTAATSGTYVMDALFSTFPGGIGFSLSIVATTVILLLFGEVIPKNLAKSHGDRAFASTLWISNALYTVLYPFVILLTEFTNMVIALFKAPGDAEEAFVTSEQEVKFLIDYIGEKGQMDLEKTSMLKSIFNIGQTHVKDIMVPWISVIKIPADTTFERALELFTTYQFSRLPVYEGQFDNIIGMLHIKDVVPLIGETTTMPIKDIMRPIIFIPESVRVNQLLKEFKDKHLHIAMVINEHGAITGLVTLEDVLEEIVGEIKDEYEIPAEKIIPLKPHGFLIDATIELKDLSEILKITFERQSALTLGGFLTEHFQHLPEKGERMVYKNYVFQIQQATNKKIYQVLVFEEAREHEFSLEER